MARSSHSVLREAHQALGYMHEIPRPKWNLSLNGVTSLQFDWVIATDQEEALRGQWEVDYILLGKSHNKDDNLD